jgi:hypothetical protein
LLAEAAQTLSLDLFNLKQPRIGIVIGLKFIA